MGKSTISMAIFNSKLLVYQRVNKNLEQRRALKQRAGCFFCPKTSPWGNYVILCRLPAHEMSHEKPHGYGSIHPFTSYFDVHQGYKVLTHCHIFKNF